VEFSFGDHVLDLDRRELRRGGEVVALEPQVFDLLVYLVRNRDRVVSKDDLLATAWGGRIVSESTLTSRISAVRRAVGDDGEIQRLIRTAHRKGLRFVGDVTETQSAPGRRDLWRLCPTSHPSRYCRSPISAATRSRNISPTGWSRIIARRSREI
jgi:DNA-binding winged helix-turn-helix (wHTH) protein